MQLQIEVRGHAISNDTHSHRSEWCGKRKLSVGGIHLFFHSSSDVCPSEQAFWAPCICATNTPIRADTPLCILPSHLSHFSSPPVFWLRQALSSPGRVHTCGWSDPSGVQRLWFTAQRSCKPSSSCTMAGKGSCSSCSVHFTSNSSKYKPDLWTTPKWQVAKYWLEEGWVNSEIDWFKLEKQWGDDYLMTRVCPEGLTWWEEQ